MLVYETNLNCYLVDAFSFSVDQENDSDNLSQNTSAEDGSIFSI